MSDPVIISLSPEAVQLLRTAPAWPLRMREAMRRTIDLQNELTVGHIQAERLTGKGPFPVEQGKLGVVTNRLRASVRPSRATLSGMTINSSIGSNVRYAGAHEFGFSGSVTVRAHNRAFKGRDVYEVTHRYKEQVTKQDRHGRDTGVYKEVTKKFTTQQTGDHSSLGRDAKKVASGFVTVREHTAQRHIPARAPIQRGIRDRLSDYGTAVSAAVVESFRTTS